MNWHHWSYGTVVSRLLYNNVRRYEPGGRRIRRNLLRNTHGMSALLHFIVRTISLISIYMAVCVALDYLMVVGLSKITKIMTEIFIYIEYIEESISGYLHSSNLKWWLFSRSYWWTAIIGLTKARPQCTVNSCQTNMPESWTLGI